MQVVIHIPELVYVSEKGTLLYWPSTPWREDNEGYSGFRCRPEENPRELRNKITVNTWDSLLIWACTAMTLQDFKRPFKTLSLTFYSLIHKYLRQFIYSDWLRVCHADVF